MYPDQDKPDYTQPVTQPATQPADKEAPGRGLKYTMPAAIQYSTLKYNAIQYSNSTLQHNATALQYNAIQHTTNTIHYNTATIQNGKRAKCNTTQQQYNAIQCNRAKCNTTQQQYNAIQCNRAKCNITQQQYNATGKNVITHSNNTMQQDKM